MSAPQDNRVTETHEHHATTLSLTKFDMYFETSISSLERAAGTQGTNTTLADVQPKHTKAVQDLTTLIVADQCFCYLIRRRTLRPELLAHKLSPSATR